MGAWGSKPWPEGTAPQEGTEFMAIQKGSVTTTDPVSVPGSEKCKEKRWASPSLSGRDAVLTAQAGNTVTHNAGDIFITPDSLNQSWKQESDVLVSPVAIPPRLDFRGDL